MKTYFNITLKFPSLLDRNKELKSIGLLSVCPLRARPYLPQSKIVSIFLFLSISNFNLESSLTEILSCLFSNTDENS